MFWAVVSTAPGPLPPAIVTIFAWASASAIAGVICGSDLRTDVRHSAPVPGAVHLFHPPPARAI